MGERRIGLLTSGGDCPGLNAAIRAVVKSAHLRHGSRIVAFQDGFLGLAEDRALELGYDDVANILTRGGTILGSSNREMIFELPEDRLRGGIPGLRDRTEDALRTVRKHALAGLILTGGDGTLKVAHHLHRRGIPIVGIPKTIDNDVVGTEVTIGFDTAVTVATESLDRLHSTAESHHRVLVVEVMGRRAGWIALYAGLAGGGDIVLIPEIPYSIEKVSRVVKERMRKGRRASIVVLAEGAGKGQELSARIEESTGLECRPVVLGYLQRGGTPTPFDRLLATNLGCAAADLAASADFGKVVTWRAGRVEAVPLPDVAGKTRRIDPCSPWVSVARAVGTSFGEAPCEEGLLGDSRGAALGSDGAGPVREQADARAIEREAPPTPAAWRPRIFPAGP